MPSIRQRVADALLGHERQRLLESIDILEDAYFQGKYAFPPDRLAQGLEESASSYMIDFVTRLQTDYEPIAGFGGEDGIGTTVRGARIAPAMEA